MTPRPLLNYRNESLCYDFGAEYGPHYITEQSVRCFLRKSELWLTSWDSSTFNGRTQNMRFSQYHGIISNFVSFLFAFSWKKFTRRLMLQFVLIQRTKRPRSPNLPPRNAGTPPNSPLSNAKLRLPPAKQHSSLSSRPKPTHKDHHAADIFIIIYTSITTTYIYKII